MSKDYVTFLMPDGTEVSNDPRFDQAKALQRALDATENTGNAGVPADEQDAQTRYTRPASLNSGQPGVGENSAPDDPTLDLHGPLGSPAQQRQIDDRQQAEFAGASPSSTSVQDSDPVDSNEAVKAARKSRADRLEAAKKARDKLVASDEEPGDRDVAYSEWSAKQLQAEVAQRNAEEDRAEEDMLKIVKGMKKGDVAEMLEADDVRRADGSSEE